MNSQIKQAKLREEWKRVDRPKFSNGWDDKIADFWLAKLSQAKLETLEAIIKEVEGKRIKSIVEVEPHEIMNLPRHPNPYFNDGLATGYNKALSDLLTKLEAQKELIENNQ